MNLLFFQNCISPHQIPYIRECAFSPYINSVHLIVPRTDYVIRNHMGWDSTSLLDDTLIKLRLKPTDEEVSMLFENNENAICLFTGIRADADVFRWFKMSLKYKVKRYIITEPPLIYNKPLWMHYLRFFLQDYKFVSHIDGIFAFGDIAVNYYRSISKRWTVFPFQYVTEAVKRTLPPPSGKVKLLFVGSLIPRKNVKIVMEALKNNTDIEFTLVGDGEERQFLESLALKNHVDARFLGIKPMKDVPNIMQQNDVLILPSLHDGWGAVVNEAMTLGLYVIVSDRCGAKVLVVDGRDGLIFKCRDVHSLKYSLNSVNKHIEEIRHNTYNRIIRSSRIQGEKVAKYFLNCISQNKE